VPTTLINSLKSTNDITIEVWIKSGTTNTGGATDPIVGISNPNNKNQRNFSLAQQDSKYRGLLRTTWTSANGTNLATNTGNNYAQTVLSHVVYTYTDDDGVGRIYVNGNLVKETNDIGGNFSGWANDYLLVFANDFNTSDINERAWIGEIHMVAIYNKALSVSEINQNYSAGEE
jgi:hypothetical protein